MNRKFNITMHAPLGLRHGTLCFTEYSGNIRGTLTLLGGSDSFTGHITEKGIIEFSGRLTSKLHSFSYSAKGNIANSMLTLDVIGDRYSFRITGNEIKPQEENSK